MRLCLCQRRVNELAERPPVEWQHTLSRVRQTCLSLLPPVWSLDLVMITKRWIHLSPPHGRHVQQNNKTQTIQCNPHLNKPVKERSAYVQRRKHGVCATVAFCMNLAAAANAFSQIRCRTRILQHRESRGRGCGLCEGVRGVPLLLCDICERNESLRWRWSPLRKASCLLCQTPSPHCQSLQRRTWPRRGLIRKWKSFCLETPRSCRRGYRCDGSSSSAN